ncbi:MAG: GntR family transcriptional regulator [Rhodospirillales bacterium CG15_BIG_FIL_POST_REV_8_21_14_020_66_15]|nr:MAG: GntR family transcriptional regulator [Rhodospirillales bacterium CG15_BIG_FIL_POST_REV_8_21_14_020_66_15]
MDRPSLHDTIVDRVRTMVYDGDLRPGEKVPERRLCETLGISRTPLREALKVLASEGVLELLPNRGARVARLTAEDVDEMFPVMGALEALAGELACANATEADLAELRALHYQMALHHTRGERAEYFALNQKIHEKIMGSAGNGLLVSLYEGLAGRIRRARYISSITPDRWKQAMAEHEEILAALEARDGRHLALVLKDHLRNKCEAVKEAIRRGAEEDAA